jgi:molecular chaperone DnaK
VTFDIDANGIVNVQARDKGTGKEQSIRIQANGGLSETEIKKMAEDAERFKDEDKKKRELVEARNQGEALIHSTEKSLADLGDKAAAEKPKIDAAISELREALKGDNVETIKTKTQAVAQVAMKLGEAIYAPGGPGAAPGDGPGAATDGASAKKAGGDNVVDADFEEVKEDPKKKSA